MNGPAEEVVRRATAAGRTVATAESCTGGLIAAALTDVPGASAAFTHGVISYADEAKTGLLNVPAGLIERHGAVSAEVAEAMAKGMRRLARSDLAVAVTGIAGPSGGSADKPVGLVWFGLASEHETQTHRCVFEGEDRTGVRTRAVETALCLLRDAL